MSSQMNKDERNHEKKEKKISNTFVKKLKYKEGDPK